MQSEYAATARKLLSHHGDKAEIVEATIEGYLGSCDRKFDVVAVLGVLYAFVDYYSVLKSIARISEDLIAIDSLWPRTETVNHDAAAVEFLTNQGINLASTNGAVVGYGSRITPAGLKIVMSTLGFVSNEPELKPRKLERDSDVYNVEHRTAEAARFLIRFRKTSKAIPTIGEGLSRTAPVGGFLKWSETPPYETMPKVPDWKFDDSTAKEFQAIAETNIPDYERVIGLCLRIAERECSKDDRIIDVGSALGHTLEAFHNAGFRNLIGVESSESMAKSAFRGIETVISETFPIEKGPFAMVMANWTLHFVKDREAYVADMFRGLREDGIAVISDKMLTSKLSLELYHDFKRSKGVSEDAIERKSESLRGVLVPYPIDWYYRTFQEVGFRSVEILNAAPSFITFLLRK